MKRFWAGFLSLVLAVGVLVVTTPCDCRDAYAFLAKTSSNQEAQCPFCSKHKSCSARPVLDQQTVLIHHSSGFFSPAGFVTLAASSRNLPSSASVVLPEIYQSPPHSPPLSLRI